MAFLNSYITSVGQDLLTAAASGEKITWTRAATSSWDVDSKTDSEMRDLSSIVQSDDQYTGSGNVSSFIYIDGSPKTASINCQIDNSEYQSGGLANLFGVWAKTDGTYTSEQLVFVARRGGANQTSIPSRDLDSEYKLFIKFGIRMDSFENPANVTLTVANDIYATATELYDEIIAREDFDSRSVTTHSADSALAGDPQNIYGEKTFKNNTKHSGNVLPTTSTLNIGSNTSSERWNAVYATTFNGTTFTGNSATTTKLNTARYIDGVSFDGSSNITHYGECTTPAATAIKEVSIPGLVTHQGAVVIIKFAETNTATQPRLRVNGVQEYYIYHHRVDDGSTSSSYEYIGNTEATSWGPGESVMFVYDSTNDSNGTLNSGKWLIVSKPRVTQYSYVGTATSGLFPLVFTAGAAASSSINAGTKSLYTDSVNSLYYNPSTNTLYCPSFYGSVIGSSQRLYVSTTISAYAYSSEFEISNITGTTLLWSTNRSIAPSTDYGLNLGYYSPTSSLCRRWNYVYANYLGSSSSHISTAYIDSIYVGSTTLLNYIKNITVTNATKATQDSSGNVISSSYAASLTKNGSVSLSSSNTNTALTLKSKSNSTLSTVYISDIVANALRGNGGYGSTSTSSYGEIGSVGLFIYMGRRTDSVDSDLYLHGGNLVSGSRLVPIQIRRPDVQSGITEGYNISLSNFNIYQADSVNGVLKPMSGTWALLNEALDYNNNEMVGRYYWNIVLAVRVY